MITKPPVCEVVVTRGGARAMLDHSVGEVMHPVVGPLVEAEELYIAPSRLAHRLRTYDPDPLVLFDVGLGAGTNAVLAWRVSEARATGDQRRLSIVSFETSLTAFDLALQQEHHEAFGFEGASLEAGKQLLAHGVYETERTSWRLVPGDVHKTLLEQAREQADVVFWDLYSPRAHPGFWTVEAFTHLRRACRSGSSVHTYSSATAVRSALLLAGFAVGTGLSIGEKTQTTVAAVDVNDLALPLDQRWLQRLARSHAGWPSDAPANALELVRALPQFNRVDVRTSP
jgi:queuine tRNA-ribosyltransferase